MGKTRDLLKKIRDTKGIFHAKMGTIKNRNSIDLTEAEDIKKKWQEYTEELYKKDLNDPDEHNGVITRLEPDILECKVKWALGSITTNKDSGSDGIPVELFQILNDVCILSRVKQITSPGWMHETSAWGWCTGKTQKDGVGREVGGGIRMGNTCKSTGDSCQCMTKTTTIL